MADTSSRAGTAYFSPEILEWTARTHVPHDEGLARAFHAPGKEGIPAIMVGPSEGALLGLLVRLASARTIVEVGTLAGYSGIHLARALPPGGHLYTIELDPRHAEVARASFATAGVLDRVTILVGRGAEMLASLEDRAPFDAVFLDADKASYDVYGRWAARNVRRGGLLLGDNAFYFGDLLKEGDEAAAAVRRFHEEARESFDTVCIPTPDGLLLGIKR